MAAQHDRIAYLERELGDVREEGKVRVEEAERWRGRCWEMEGEVAEGLEGRLKEYNGVRAELEAQMRRDAEIVAAQHERIEYLEKELVEVREEGKVRDGELE